MRPLIVAWCLIVAAAALWTGFTTRPGQFDFRWMTGFFPPHYGYSAYAMVPLLFLGPRWARWFAGVALLLSGNRAAWVGAIAGWASRQGGEHVGAKLLLAFALCISAVFGGLLMKEAHVRGRTDNVRVQIWTTAWEVAVKHPRGIGAGNFCYGIAGREVTKVHSDVLQLLVEQGFLVAGAVLLLLLGGLCWLPAGPWKETLIALSVVSVIDNRLHHPACAALYVFVWAAAIRNGRSPRAWAGRT